MNRISVAVRRQVAADDADGTAAAPLAVRRLLTIGAKEVRPDRRKLTAVPWRLFYLWTIRTE